MKNKLCQTLASRCKREWGTESVPGNRIPSFSGMADKLPALVMVMFFPFFLLSPYS